MNVQGERPGKIVQGKWEMSRGKCPGGIVYGECPDAMYMGNCPGEMSGGGKCPGEMSRSRVDFDVNI